MKEIRIKTQAKLDKLQKVAEDQHVIIDAELRLNNLLHVYGQLTINKALDCNWDEDRHVRASDNATVRAWNSATVEAWDNAIVEASGNATVRASDNATVRAWDNATVRASGNATVRAWDNTTVRAWDSTTVRAWGSTTVEASGNATVYVLSASLNVSLFGYAVCFRMHDLKLKVAKTENATVISPAVSNTTDAWLEDHGIQPVKTVLLYKKVSKDFKTQENTANETLWAIGSTLEHPNYNPKNEECGPRKYHACPRPYFCDDFRGSTGDRYIAIEVAKEDLYVWPTNPFYPHKVAFRKGKVLREVDSFGRDV